MRNKKGFTLIELIIIIIIIGVILVFSLPNVTSTLERQKKDAMIVDAKDFVHKTQTYMLKHMDYPTNDNPVPYTLNTVDPRKEIKDSPFGGTYDRVNSVVTVERIVTTYDWKDESGNTITEERVEYNYQIILQDNKHILNATVDDLNSDDKYNKIHDN